MTPWVLRRPSQFRLEPPLALTSPEYAKDLNEVKVWGVLSGSMRKQDQSELALFWALNTPLAWNRIAAQISAGARADSDRECALIALLNVTLSDALIACWDSSTVTFSGGRSRQSERVRRLRTTVGAMAGLFAVNPGTPAHPEYPSAHSSMSGAAAFILAAAFGEKTAFSPHVGDTSGHSFVFELLGRDSGNRRCARFSAAFHFRTSCVRANALGISVADYVSRHAMRERGDDRDDDRD